MFRKKAVGNDISQQEVSTVIGHDYEFKGELKGNAVVRIEGKVSGNVSVEAGVVLGEKGMIEGDIFTSSAIIYGTVNGNVNATRLQIKKTGCITGEIFTDSLQIELGARYNGRLHMQQEEEPVLERAS
jgi:cytoskeletal protein CcmA (bactofilin family)